MTKKPTEWFVSYASASDDPRDRQREDERQNERERDSGGQLLRGRRRRDEQRKHEQHASDLSRRADGEPQHDEEADVEQSHRNTPCLRRRLVDRAEEERTANSCEERECEHRNRRERPDLVAS